MDSLRAAIDAVLRAADETLLALCIPDPRERDDLLGKLHALKDVTARYRVVVSQTLWPVMWLRLFQRAAIPLTDSAAQSFAKWQWSAFRHGQAWLMQHSNEKGNFGGKRRNPQDEPQLVGFFLDEMLLYGERPDWFKLEWRMVLRPKVIEQKARPSVDKAKRAAGSGVVAVVKRCLATAAVEADPAEVFEGKSGLESSLSLDEVVKLLLSRFPIAQRYKPSTIKRALPALIKCPRGRPPRKVKPR